LGGTAARRPNTRQYIVHLSSVPSVLSYRGGVNGLRGTATVDDSEDEYDEDDGADDGAEGDADGGGSGGNGSDGNGSDGNGSDGNGSDGNGSDGNGSDGNGSDGNGSDGNGSDGNGSDGNGSDGNGSDGNGSDGNGSGGNGGNSSAPGSAPAPSAPGSAPAPSAPGSAPATAAATSAGATAAGTEATAAAARSERNLSSESRLDSLDAVIQSAAAAAAEEAMEMGGLVRSAGAAAAGVQGRGLGEGGVRISSALRFGEAGWDALVGRVRRRLGKVRSRSAGVGPRLLARIAAAAVAAAAEEAAGAAAAGTGTGAGAAAAANSQTSTFNAFNPSATSVAFSATGNMTRGKIGEGDRGPLAAGATSPMLTAQQLTAQQPTVQQLSARAVRIMRTTPWGRLMRPDVRLPHVQAFTRFLEASHRSLLRSLGIPASAISHSYSYLLNSFAAQLTPSEARRLKWHPAVAGVEGERAVRVSTVHSPEFLKLGQSLWNANGGKSTAGEGVIVGVIDSGIWPEHPSFSDPDPGGAAYSAVPARWRGKCTTTADYPACNGKVIGARYFLKGAEGQFGDLDETEDYRSARDKVEHGTWCAGAAAGNAGVTVAVGGRTYGTASGMAPRARLAVYKALWSIGGEVGVGVSSDLIAAAEKAVADGVDVLSCSWGGLAMYFQDLPYLRGLKAGVVTAFAAGNEGRPNPVSMWGTLGNVSPFYLTVGASTMGREYKAVLTLGDGATFSGRSMGGTSETAAALPLVLAESAVSYVGGTAEATECHPEDIDPALVEGKFLVCALLSRDLQSVLDDAQTMLVAAVVIISGSAKADMQHRMPYSKTPSILIKYAPGKTIKSYIAAGGSPTATLSAATASFSTNAPQVAYFSSTGPPRSPYYWPPLLWRDLPTNDILKPDVMGPGFLLWAAAPGKSVDTAATDAPNFNYWSGTSMATPHLAGIMALIVQKKPNWSPAQVISAITTTAFTRNKNRQLIQRADATNANAWDYGGGHVDPTRVLDPGLTFHAAHRDYVNFLMGRDPLRAMKRFWRMGEPRPIIPQNLNRASIAVTRLRGVAVVYRRVKNVYNKKSTYRVKLDIPPEFSVKVSPEKFTILPGESKVFGVTIMGLSRFLNWRKFRFGTILWTDQYGHSVPMRLVVRSCFILCTVS
ncbi:hypothetical protein CLOM_g24219, partial [Closterium sp. NIES-68]